MPRTFRTPLLIAALAGLLAVVFAGHAFVNYDTAYALLWGDDLAHGMMPDLELTLAPTPHPLATLAGMLVTPGTMDLLSYVFLATAGWLVFRLGHEWFGFAAGIAAAVLFLTREPVLSFGLRAYVDVPYLCLVLGALLLETRRRRSGVPVLLLLTLAGLLRPEAWLFSVAYVVWLRDPRLLPLAAAAPVLWVLHDLLLTGDPLHSLLGTRENADELGRKTGIVDLPVYGPRRLGEVLREPVLVGAAIGAVLAWRDRTRRPLAALALALVAFAFLAIAGLPIITRYLLLPAALACVLCGAGLVAGIERRSWRAASLVILALLVVFGPAQVRRVDRLERAIAIQDRILADLDDLPAEAFGCAPVATTNRRPVPHLALDFGIDPAIVRVGDPQTACRYVGPADRTVAQRFIFDARDPVRVLPRLAPGWRKLAGNASWTVYGR